MKKKTDLDAVLARKRKTARTVQIVLTVFKSLFSCLAFSLCVVSMVLLIEKNNLFGFFLAVLAIAMAAAAYVFSAACLLWNHYSARLLPLRWTVTSAVSIGAVILTLAKWILTEASSLSYVFAACLCLQCVPTVWEIMELSAWFSRKRNKKKAAVPRKEA